MALSPLRGRVDRAQQRSLSFSRNESFGNQLSPSWRSVDAARRCNSTDAFTISKPKFKRVVLSDKFDELEEERPKTNHPRQTVSTNDSILFSDHLANPLRCSDGSVDSRDQWCDDRSQITVDCHGNENDMLFDHDGERDAVLRRTRSDIFEFFASASSLEKGSGARCKREHRRNMLSPIARHGRQPLSSILSLDSNPNVSNLCTQLETSTLLRDPLSPRASQDREDNELRPPSPIPSPFLAASGESAQLPRCHMSHDLLDMNCIEASTLANLITGGLPDIFDDVFIIDARFGYEYEGGHIRGALNITSLDHLINMFFDDQAPVVRSRTCIVFHCEFSTVRGPCLCRDFRRYDRGVNEYPNLSYPELYLLANGYANFFRHFPNLCDPKGYVMMDDAQYMKARTENMVRVRRRLELGRRSAGTSSRNRRRESPS